MDSRAKIVACLQAAAIDLEIEPPPEEQASQVIGLGLIEAVSRLFPELPSSLHQPLADRYREHFLVLNKAQPRLFPQARTVLEQLSSNYLLAVATGKSRRGLDKELDETGLRPLFQANRCADETLSKPHPQMLQEILQELRPFVQGVYMMPAFGRYDLVADVLDILEDGGSKDGETRN